MLKARFAKDRWKIVRIVYWTRAGSDIADHSELLLMNRYNRKVRVLKLKGQWLWSDFPDETYWGQK